MKKSIWKTIGKVLTYVFAAFVGGVIALTVLLHFVGESPAGKLFYLNRLIDYCFIGEYEDADLGDAAAGAMVAATGDRWSYYIPASAFDAYQEQMSNAYVGIGITITATEEGDFTVAQVMKSGPAENAGMLPGDVLLAVDGQSCEDLTMSAFRELIRGEEGTEVVLTVLRQEQELELPMNRMYFETPVATGTMLADSIGLVTIDNFDGRCASETISVIDDLIGQGAEALVFDVRNNPGGYKDELVKVLDYLLPEGELFISEDYRGNRQVDTSDASCVTLPMAVLVNENSYSAAEYFAAALSEYDAAMVVGNPTCGKGFFQNTFRLPDGSAVSLSVGRYFTPKGVSLAGVGITPDVLVAVDEQTQTAIFSHQLAPEDDPQLAAAIHGLKSRK